MKISWKVILIFVGIAALVGINWALFSGNVLGMPDEVKNALRSNDRVQVENWQDLQSFSFMPITHAPITGLILYPEGTLDVRLYAPLAQMIAEEGYLVIFLSRRLENELDFAAEAIRINKAIAAHPDITNWIVGGLTWSSVLPVDFALKNTDKIDGVVLLASRLDRGTSLVETDLPILYIYGTRDDENEDLLNSQSAYLPAHTIYGKIEGGNRMQYGYTGPMARDVAATISTTEQQRAAADYILDFLRSLNN